MIFSRTATQTVLLGIYALLAVYLTAGLTMALPLVTQTTFKFNLPIDSVVFVAFLTMVVIASNRFFPLLPFRLRDLFEGSHDALVAQSDADTPRMAAIRIVVIAAASLFLELVLIRWQASLFPVFALYKNYTLLACFCGLGIGYALADKRLMLSATLPLLAITVALLSVLRHHTGDNLRDILFVIPLQEESYVGTLTGNKDVLTTNLLRVFPVCLALIVTFLLNAFTLIPVGQYCGFLMNRVKPLVGYSCNLVGSILGVAVLFLLGAVWSGPEIWFGIGASLILWPQIAVINARRLGIASTLACIFVCAWPFVPMIHAIYSPYQMISVNPKKDGLVGIVAAGTYFQKVYDLSAASVEASINPRIKQIVGHYELPYRMASSLGQVAIVGAGTGNDVAAALRLGASNVDAVEIDPAIYQLGYYWHPEHPYSNPTVHMVINDARNFFRDTKKTYDAIVYGVLDAHVVLSAGPGGARLDSYVYTKEGLEEAYNHLNPDGLLAVSFALQTNTMGQKIFKILSMLPDASKPQALVTGYDNFGTTMYIVKKGGELILPSDFINSHLIEHGTYWYNEHNNEALDLPTDDWPFFYMDHRSFPSTYITSLGIILVLSWLLMRKFLPQQKPSLSYMPFFFLGGGFMLIEAKAITELGLLFGNTWQVVGIAIVGVLVMCFLANWLCLRHPPKSIAWAWALLLLVVGAGYLHAAFANSAGYAEAWIKFGKAMMLVCPMFFSGIIFSNLLAKAKDTASAMAHNLAGAMLGGVLEYNAMEFGFASLYLIAFALYVGALLTASIKGRAGAGA